MASRLPRGAAKNRSTSRYSVEAVARAAQLLRQFSRVAPHHTGGELAQSTGLSTKLVQRTMSTLQRHGLVRASHSFDDCGDPQHYRLGLRWLQLADVRRRQVDIRLLALPAMRSIRDAVNETVILSVRVGHRRVNLDYVESTQPIRRLTQLGFEVPLHVGATGRVLLSGLSSEEFEHYVQSNPLAILATDTRIVEDRLREEVEHVRSAGYAVAFREITSDTAAVSAPIRDHTGDVVGAMTISCPEDRFTSKLKQACIREITHAAESVSGALGYRTNLAE